MVSKSLLLQVYRNAEALSWLTTTFFVLYMLAMMITLLNLLIGVMGDSFDKVRSQEEAEFLKGRASVIDDFEAGMSEREIKKLEYAIGCLSSVDCLSFVEPRLEHTCMLYFHLKCLKNLTHGLERSRRWRRLLGMSWNDFAQSSHVGVL